MRNVLPQILFSLLASLSVISAGATEIFSIEHHKTPHRAHAQFLSDDDVVHGVQPTRNLALEAAERLSIPVPSGELWTATRTDSYDTEHGRAWFGSLTAFAGGPQGRIMLIALNDGMLLGELSLGGEHFLIWPHAESGEHELIRKAPSRVPSCGVEHRGELFSEVRTTSSADLGSAEADGVLLLAKDGASEAEHEAETSTAGTSQAAESITTLDILPLYHSALSYNDVRNEYIKWIHQANEVFENSNIPAVYTLASDPLAVSAADLPATDCFAGLERSLDWMQERPDVVQHLRNLHGADFVALALPPSASSCGVDSQGFPIDACGIASLPWRDGFRKKVTARSKLYWTQRSFIAARLFCGEDDLTFPHELGHTFGAIHEDDDDDAPSGIYSAFSSRGFGLEFEHEGKTRATIMACAHTGETDIVDRNICNRVPHFSSATEPGPGGVSIGDSTHDNRQLIINKAPSYGTFRSRGGPTVRILSPSRDGIVGLRSNHFEAVASEVVEGVTVDLSDQVIWRVRSLRSVEGREPVILGMGQGRTVTDFDLSSLASHIVANVEFELIAVVVGSSGARADWRIPIRFHPVASFTESCSTLECTFDASASATPNDVAEYQWSFKIADCYQAYGRICSDTVSETAPVMSHYFPGYQSYDVKLEITDVFGISSSVTKRIALEASAGSRVRVGAWYNPDRPGHGIDLYRNVNNDYVVFWYTYEELTDEPTWYLSDPAPIVANQFRARLRKVTRAADGTLGSRELGSIGLDFSDSRTAAFQWSFSLDGRRAHGWERFEHLYGSSFRMGAWYDPEDSGWGLQVNEERHPSEGGSLVALAFYDQAGRPRWVSGFKGHYPVSQNVTIPVSYHEGENLCPFSSCFGGEPAVTYIPAGTITLNMPLNGSPGNARTDVTTPSGSRWFRSTTIVRLAAGY